MCINIGVVVGKKSIMAKGITKLLEMKKKGVVKMDVTLYAALEMNGEYEDIDVS